MRIREQLVYSRFRFGYVLFLVAYDSYNKPTVLVYSGAVFIAFAYLGIYVHFSFFDVSVYGISCSFRHTVTSCPVPSLMHCHVTVGRSVAEQVNWQEAHCTHAA